MLWKCWDSMFNILPNDNLLIRSHSMRHFVWRIAWRIHTCSCSTQIWPNFSMSCENVSKRLFVGIYITLFLRLFFFFYLGSNQTGVSIVPIFHFHDYHQDSSTSSRNDNWNCFFFVSPSQNDAHIGIPKKLSQQKNCFSKSCSISFRTSFLWHSRVENDLCLAQLYFKSKFIVRCHFAYEQFTLRFLTTRSKFEKFEDASFLNFWRT